MMVRRADLRDIYVEDGRAAVFVHDQVIVLSEIATAILEATSTSRWVSLEAITHTVVAAFGQPEPPLVATDLTRRQILDLVAHRVLVQDLPDSQTSFTPASVAALRDALRHLVSDGDTPWSLPAGVSGPQFLAAAARHRIAPTIAAGADRLALPAETTAQLTATTDQESASVAVLSAELAEIVEALERAGVRVLALKGLALAVQAHGHVGARGTGDHDLLVPPGELELAHEVLTSLGWAPAGGFPRPEGSWAWGYLVRTYYELSLSRRGSPIDLHWHLVPVRSSFPEFATLWSRRVLVRIGDRDIPTLSAYDAMAHSASHSAKDHWRWLRGLLDVHLLLSDSNTWLEADRPLRPDQLLSVGLAARMFGVPPNAPAVVHQAVRLAAESWEHALAQQAGPSHIDVATRVPGVGLLRALVALRRAGARPGDYQRTLSMSVIPLAYAAEISARSSLIAVPRVLARRVGEVTGLWRRAGFLHLQHLCEPPAPGDGESPENLGEGADQTIGPAQL